MATSRAKLITLIAALGLLGVLILGGLSWRGIFAWYHLGRLQGEPGCLVECLSALPGSPRALAVSQYAQTPVGLEAIAKVYASRLLGMVSGSPPIHASFVMRFDLQGSEIALLGLRLEETQSQWRYWHVIESTSTGDPASQVAQQDGSRLTRVVSTPGGGQQSVIISAPGRAGEGLYCRADAPSAGQRFLIRARELLLESNLRAGDVLSLRDHPNLAVRVLRGDVAFLLTGMTAMGSKTPPEDEIVCLVLRTDPGPGKVAPSVCVLPLLLEAVEKGNLQVAPLAREALETLAVNPSDPVPHLVQHLKTFDRDLWRCRHPDCHPWLCEQTGPNTQHWIHPAVKGLIVLGPEVLPAFTRALREGTWSDKAACRRALEVYEEHGRTALPYLDELLQDTVGPLKGAAWEVATRIRQAEPED